MMPRLVVALTLAFMPVFTAVRAAAPAGTPCSSLAALTIPAVTIDAAAVVPAGSFTPPGSPAAMTLPAFCRVVATARPTSDSEIRFEVWIPPNEAWNGKFQGVGNGGYQGSIPFAAMALALRRGYATAGTDTGHTGDDMRFGQGHPEKLIDYGHRAVHVMTESAKLIVRNGTGRFAERSYFVGCSAGGQEGLSEAQRYPDDYDGIVAGDPVNNRIRQTFHFLASWIATHDAEGRPIIPAAKLALLTRSAVTACDAIDGLRDGLIDDPRRCGFDPATIACKGPSDEATCLTGPQVDAVRKVYEGTKNPRTGERIFAGLPRGSEGFGDSAIQGWRQYTLEPAVPMRSDFFRYFLLHDPNSDFRTVDVERDLAYAERKLPFMAAVDTNLAPFRKNRGKLLMYTGWSDPVIPPEDAVAYYEAVTKVMGGPAATQDFFRLFMAPGVGHCGGGPGPNQFDALGALEQWVEKGVAPDRLIAAHSTNGAVDRTRPLCRYPLVARHKGKGSIDDAANFSCVNPPQP